MTKHRTLRRILAVAAVAALPLAAAGTDAHADGGVSWQTYAQGHGYLSSDANGSVIIVSNNPGHNWYDHQLSNGRWLEIRSGSLFNSTQQCIEINGTSYANAYDKQTSTLDLWPCSKSATSAPWNLQWNPKVVLFQRHTPRDALIFLRVKARVPRRGECRGIGMLVSLVPKTSGQWLVVSF